MLALTLLFVLVHVLPARTRADSSLHSHEDIIPFLQPDFVLRLDGRSSNRPAQVISRPLNQLPGTQKPLFVILEKGSSTWVSNLICQHLLVP